LEHERNRELDAIERDFHIPRELHELPQALKTLLTMTPENTQLVLLLDGIDQLLPDDHAHGLWWLPLELPERVKLVVSTVSESLTIMDVLRQSLPTEQLLEVPTFSRQDAENSLNLWLHDAGRELVEEQRKAILTSFEHSGLPLYLRLAFEEARLWQEDDGVPTYRGRCGLANDVEGVVLDLLERLSREENHGPVMVRRSLGLLAAARSGLTEDEILGLLSADEEVREEFERRYRFHEAPQGRLPVVVWSRLFLDLAPYLMERAADGTTVLSFFHRQVGEVIRDWFLDEEELRARQRQLADYFAAQPMFLDGAGRAVPNARKTNELPTQLLAAGREAQLEELLCDLDFIEAKCAAGGIFDLLRNYSQARAMTSRSELSWSEARRLIEYASFVGRQAHNLSSFPNLAYQLAANEPVLTRTSSLARERMEAGDGPRVWVSWENRSEDSEPVERRLVGHAVDVGAMAFSPDDRSILTAAGDGTLRIWDRSTGEVQRVLRGHDKVVDRAGFDASGQRIATRSQDGTQGLWDATTGARLARWKHWTLEDLHASRVAPFFTRDGRHLAHVCGENLLELRDPVSSAVQCRLRVRDTKLTIYGFTPNGVLVVTGHEDGRLCVWSRRDGRLRREIRHHEAAVVGLAFSGDGRVVASTALDGTLLMSQLDVAHTVGNASGLANPAFLMALSHDGKFMVFRERDRNTYSVGTRSTKGMSERWRRECLTENRLNFLRLDTGRLKKLEGPMGLPERAVFIGRGGRMVSTACDGRVLLWDLAATEEPKVLFDGMLDRPCRFSLSTDERLLALACNETCALVDLTKNELLAVVRSPGLERPPPMISRDKKTLLTSSRAGGVILWSIERALQTFRPGAEKAPEVAIQPDPVGRRLLHLAGADQISCRDVDSGQELSSFEKKGDAHTEIRFSRDGRTVAFPSADTISVRDTNTGELVSELRAPRWFLRGLDLSPGGGRLAGISSEGMLRAWDLESRLLVGRYEEPLGARENKETAELKVELLLAAGGRGAFCRYTPDGTSLFVAFKNHGLTELDPESFEPRRRIAELDESTRVTSHRRRDRRRVVRGLSISPDGMRLAVVHGKGRLRLICRVSGRELASHGFEKAGVDDVAFSPDCQWLAVAHSDRTVRLIEAITGRELAKVVDLPAKALAFRLGGRELVTDGVGHRLAWRGLEPGPAVVVPRAQGDSKAKSEIVADCQSCSARLDLSPPTNRLLRKLLFRPVMKYDADLEELNELKSAPGLLHECSRCGQAVRVAPFVVYEPALSELDRRGAEWLDETDAEEQDCKERERKSLGEGMKIELVSPKKKVHRGVESDLVRLGVEQESHEPSTKRVPLTIEDSIEPSVGEECSNEHVESTPQVTSSVKRDRDRPKVYTTSPIKPALIWFGIPLVLLVLLCVFGDRCDFYPF